MKYNFTIIFLFFLSLNGWSQNSNPFQIGTPKKVKKQKVGNSSPSVAKDTAHIISPASGNPFEIDGTPKHSILKTNTPSEKSNVIPDTSNSNPFAIDGKPKPVLDTPTSTSNPFIIKTYPKNSPNPIDPSPKTKDNTLVKSKKDGDLLFYLITGSLFLFTVLLTLYRAYFQRVYQTFLSSNLLKTIFQKVSNSNNYSVFVLLYSIFIFNLSLFIYLASINLGFDIVPSAYSFSLILLSVFSFFVVRHLILRIIGSVFPVRENIGLYSFLIINFNIGIGVVLLPLNLIIAYVSPDLGRIFIYITFGLFAILIMYRSIRGLNIAKKVISYHKLHFFLYLCTIEIAPLLILIKYLSKLGY